MKLAKASQQEIDTLMKWLQDREAAKFENAKDRPPAFLRVVFGYETLVNNCCDKTKDVLDWSPELQAAKEDKARLDWLEKPGSWPAFMAAIELLSGKVDGKNLPGWTWRQALDEARGAGRI